MITAYIEGLDQVILNIEQILPNETEHIKQVIGLCGEALEFYVKNNASLVDGHDIDWMFAHNHPYSANKPENSGPHPDYIVHRQSGMLYENIEKVTNEGFETVSIEVGVDIQKVPYINDLIYGSNLMRPRNFLSKGFEESEDTIRGFFKGG